MLCKRHTLEMHFLMDLDLSLFFSVYKYKHKYVPLRKTLVSIRNHSCPFSRTMIQAGWLVFLSGSWKMSTSRRQIMLFIVRWDVSSYRYSHLSSQLQRRLDSQLRLDPWGMQWNTHHKFNVYANHLPFIVKGDGLLLHLTADCRNSQEGEVRFNLP